LVEKIKSLENVRVKKIPFELDNGQVVYIPGPFSIVQRCSAQYDEEEDEDDVEGEDSCSDSDSDSSRKFIVRTEFGHIRLQPFLSPHGGASTVNTSQDVVAGHCVLPPDIFQLCVNNNWGVAHPFAGRFHPIVGSTVPESTMVFRAPRSLDEAQWLWKILYASYLWASEK
jgi:hypothetical protein